MLCQNCKKRMANVHFTQVINNNKVELYLCEQCAREKGQFNFGSPVGFNDFISGLIGYSNTLPYITSAPQNPVCEKCGMSFEEFQKLGKLGCGNCYEIYGERLKSIIKRLHGAVEHTGKLSNRVSKSIKTSKEIEKLKELLNKAVQNEQYEKAAEFRDRIKSLETNKG